MVDFCEPHEDGRVTSVVSSHVVDGGLRLQQYIARGESVQTISVFGSADGLIAVQATSWPFNLRAMPRASELALTPGKTAPSFSAVSKSTLLLYAGFVFKGRPHQLMAAIEPSNVPRDQIHTESLRETRTLNAGSRAPDAKFTTLSGSPSVAKGSVAARSLILSRLQRERPLSSALGPLIQVRTLLNHRARFGHMTMAIPK